VINATAIEDETTRAKAAESTLTTATSANTDAIAINTTAIETNATAIEDETTRAKAAEVTLTTATTANTDAIVINATAIEDETTRAKAAEATLTNNLTTEVNRATGVEATKEALANKSTDIVTDATSDTKYPSVKSVKTY